MKEKSKQFSRLLLLQLSCRLFRSCCGRTTSRCRRCRSRRAFGGHGRWDRLPSSQAINEIHRGHPLVGHPGDFCPGHAVRHDHMPAHVIHHGELVLTDGAAREAAVLLHVLLQRALVGVGGPADVAALVPAAVRCRNQRLGW